MTHPDPKIASRADTPFRINFEQQKKRAKELLKAFNANNNQAISRFQNKHPKFVNQQSLPFASANLSDAQLVIARELGLVSWPKLKSHILSMKNENRAINTKATAPDAQYKTLHIRCGTDLQSTLPAAGFIGDFLEYTEAYVQGPIVHNSAFKSTRMKFLQDAYEPFLDMSSAEMCQRDEQSERNLTKAAHVYERVVLWFEHDSFDQLILARILAYFFSSQCPKIFELVSINNFPGSARFIGMGQLPADAIRLIWKKRKPITRLQLRLGNEIWQALGNSTPCTLYNIIQSDKIKHLENMHDALLRHLQELPSTKNGLCLTEQLTLELLNEETSTAGQLFEKLMRERDPLPWLGDIMYWHILQSMMKTSQPAFKISDEDLTIPWNKKTLSITEIGRMLLEEKLDWLELNPPERWLGGIKINTRGLCWRWNHKKAQALLC